MRYVALILSGLAATASMAIGVDDIADAPPADRHALEFYLLRDVADATHNIKVIAPSGDTWYRSATPGVDLGDLEFQQARVSPNEYNSGYVIWLSVRGERVSKVRKWFDEIREQRLGVLISGKCQTEAIVHSSIGPYFCVGGFSSVVDAEAACALIRAGGDTTRAGEALRQLQHDRADAEAVALQRAKRSPEEVTPPVAFSLFSVRTERDDEHPTRAGAFRGAAWYRANAPGLDSKQCKSIRHFGARPGEDRVETFVRPEELAGVSRWLSDNAGQPCGLFENGKLLGVVLLPNAVDEMLKRFGLSVESDAEQATSQPSMTVDVRTTGVMADIWPYSPMSVVALSTVRDSKHTTPLQDGDGVTWYGSSSDHVSLCADGGIDALVSASPDGTFRVCVRVQTGVHNPLSDFCRKRANERVGVVSLDLPLIALRLGDQAPDAIELTSFSNWKAAANMRDLLRNEPPQSHAALSEKQANARILAWCASRGEKAPDVREKDEGTVFHYPFANIWRRLNAQLVVLGMQGYLIHGDDIAKLGESSGGMGLQDACVTDLDADGEPELIFVTSWGSGIHRSQVGVWSDAWPAPKVRMAGLSHVGGPDYELRRFSDQHVAVFVGAKRVGRIKLRPTSDGPEPDIVLDPDLPPAIRRTLVRFGVPGEPPGGGESDDTSAKEATPPKSR
ncbi:MAG: hypothetical protein KDA33_11610 [Phycisphaerales bacterium]|nr:hypothetical protein [Phycisphaerales bacterium]